MPDQFYRPEMDCPACGKVYEDFDGVGVVYCPPDQGGCGYCRHLARSGPPIRSVCDFCGDVEVRDADR